MQKPTLQAPNQIFTIEQLKEEFGKMLMLADNNVIKTVMGTMIGNKLNGVEPIWLFLVAGPSGGKTEIGNTVKKLPFVFPVDTLTVNSMASGQKKKGVQTSFLDKLPGGEGIMYIKDFTVIMSMNEMARNEIIGQFRAIYDRDFTKLTGNDADTKWSGKLGMLSCVTSIIHEEIKKFADMGERFVLYEVEQPDRRKVQNFVFDVAPYVDELRTHLQECVLEYVSYVLGKSFDMEVILHEDDRELIMELADFAAMARSGVKQDLYSQKKTVVFISDPEGPQRMQKQMIAMAYAMIAMNRADPNSKPIGPTQADKLKDEDIQILTKMAMDSIPRKRRQALVALAKYKKGITTAGLAISLRYSNDAIAPVMYELNARDFCERYKDGGIDKWMLKEEWRPVIMKYENIISVDESLTADGMDYQDTIEDKVSEALSSAFIEADSEDGGW